MFSEIDLALESVVGAPVRGPLVGAGGDGIAIALCLGVPQDRTVLQMDNRWSPAVEQVRVAGADVAVAVVGDVALRAAIFGLVNKLRAILDMETVLGSAIAFTLWNP